MIQINLEHYTITVKNNFKFTIPLLIFDDNGICLLTTTQKECYSFTCKFCFIETFLKFDKIVNVETVILMKAKENLTNFWLERQDEMEIANKRRKKIIAVVFPNLLL